MKPVLLDLFCGAGGCTKGYQEAGFYVVGVDIKPQPNYCGDEFFQMDALAALEDFPAFSAMVGDFDSIHASPPCQNDTAYRRRPNHVRPVDRLIDPTRGLLRQTGLPYVIENVPGAPLKNPVQLCGSSFGLDVRRHRLFETSFPVLTSPCNHAAQEPGRFPGATNRPNGRATVEIGVWRIPLEVQQQAMGIDWMTRGELSQAIPPAYTRHIGSYLLSQEESRSVPTDDPGCAIFVQEALVHSNLAIAEGQERVAEAVEGRADTWFRQALDEIRGLAVNEGETDDNKVRERIFHIADDALERGQR